MTPATDTIHIDARDGSGRFAAYLALPPSGRGPGLVLAQEIFGVNATMRQVADQYAAEGYVVLVPDLFWRQQPGIELGYTEADFQRAFGLYQGFDEARGVEDIQTCLDALRQRPECDGQAGVLGFCLGGKLAYLAACRTNADVAVGYYGVGIEKALDEARERKSRLVLHIAENDAFCPPEARAAIVAALSGRAQTELYVYPGVDHAFARLGGDHFHKPSALMAHERSIAALKTVMGPHPDFSALWDTHCEHEFATRDVAATMATMVEQPYVNHIPTMHGRVAHTLRSAVYQHPLVNRQPAPLGNPITTRPAGVGRTRRWGF